VHVSSAGTGCGAGIGFADQALFKPHARNLGAAENSWCYSKTGKKSDGAGWSTYGSPFKTGDVITAGEQGCLFASCLLLHLGDSQTPFFGCAWICRAGS